MTPSPLVARWLADLAWLPGQGVRRDVLIEADGDRFTTVTPAASATPAASPPQPPRTPPASSVPPDAERLRGLTLPGLANAHSHAFHRALRGTTQADRGTFWTWRERMYEVAGRLDPDSYLALARAVYAEMALAGITCVGEFHYLHHQPDGTPYADPNAMGRALIQAAAEAGLRITLLDTCYLAGGLDQTGVLPLAGPQVRFGDGDGSRWAARAEALGADHRGLLSPHAMAGAAIHSVRAVPPEHMHPVVAWTARHGAPLHIHMSEQRAENEACRAVYGVSPARLLYDEDVLGPRTTVVHATHVGAADLEAAGRQPGIRLPVPHHRTRPRRRPGPGPAAGRGRVHAHPRQRQPRRDRHPGRSPRRRVRRTPRPALARPLHRRDPAPRPPPRPAIPAWAGPTRASSPPAPGRTWSPCPSTACGPSAPPGDLALETAVFAASAADIGTVVIDGRDVVRDGVHLLVPDVPAELARTIRAALTPAD